MLRLGTQAGLNVYVGLSNAFIDEADVMSASQDPSEIIPIC